MLLLLAAAGIAGVVFVIAAVPPTDSSFYPRCQLHTLTGLHCPGCGTTRALHALLNGRVAQAVAYNALAFVVLPLLAVSLVRSLWAWDRRRPVPPTRGRSSRRAAVLPWVLFTLLIVYAVLRNIPVHPFTLLAPHEL